MKIYLKATKQEKTLSEATSTKDLFWLLKLWRVFCRGPDSWSLQSNQPHSHSAPTLQWPPPRLWQSYKTMSSLIQGDRHLHKKKTATKTSVTLLISPVPKDSFISEPGTVHQTLFILGTWHHLLQHLLSSPLLPHVSAWLSCLLFCFKAFMWLHGVYLGNPV